MRDSMSHKSSIPLYWRLQSSKYRMAGCVCKKCNTKYFPRKPICPKCRRQGRIEGMEFSGRGRIATYTIIRSAPEGYEDQVPYAIGVVEMDEGPMIAGQVVGDINALKTGVRVRTAFRKIYEDGEAGVIHYGLKWMIDKTDRK